MIPKVIHYCWFGGNEKPEIIQKCMESWKKYCPDWKIVEWNESNYDVNKHPFTKEAYACKKWAFVSDVARLEVILQNGGVYMDTDVELKGSLDKMMEHDAFFIFESNRNIASGLGFGAIKGHRSVRAMLSYYQDRHFLTDGKMDMRPCPAFNTDALQAEFPQMVRNGEKQLFDGIELFPEQVYREIAYHYSTGTWGSNELKKKTYKDTKIKRWMRDSKKFSYIDQHFGKKACELYTFIAYDFLELGAWYFIRRKLCEFFSNKE